MKPKMKTHESKDETMKTAFRISGKTVLSAILECELVSATVGNEEVPAEVLCGKPTTLYTLHTLIQRDMITIAAGYLSATKFEWLSGQIGMNWDNVMDVLESAVRQYSTNTDWLPPNKTPGEISAALGEWFEQVGDASATEVVDILSFQDDLEFLVDECFTDDDPVLASAVSDAHFRFILLRVITLLNNEAVWSTVEAVANALVEKTTLTGTDIVKIVHDHELHMELFVGRFSNFHRVRSNPEEEYNKMVPDASGSAQPDGI